jgi:hypothetical protein
LLYDLAAGDRGASWGVVRVGGRRWLTLTLVFGMLGWPAAGVQAQAPAAGRELLFGVAGHAWWLDDHLDTFVAAYRDLGVTTVRLSVDWKYIEPSPGVYRWDRYDRVLGRLADERLTIVGVFVTVPAWAASNPAACAVEQDEPKACDLPPSHRAAFERAARATLLRYPFIRHWEFWNEPDQWAHLGADVGDYVPLLARFYAIAKEVDPAIQVAAGALGGWEYLGWLYDVADAWLGPGQRPWDALAFHPYDTGRQRDADGVALSLRFAEIERIRAEMVARGDGHKPIWLTEYGWEAEPAAQAAALRRALRWLVQHDYVSMAHLHMLHDWERERFGLMRTVPEVYQRGPLDKATRFEPKEPFYSAYRSFRRPPLPVGPPGAVFPATGQQIAPEFAAAWAAVPGDGLGAPLTRAFWERRMRGDYALVQYFERGRLEWTRTDGIQFGLLGDEDLIRRGWLDAWGQALHDATRTAPIAERDARYFPETGQALAGPFLAAWEAAGGLPVLGYPRTAVLVEELPDGARLLWQYTQRGRLEQVVTAAGGGPVRLARLGVAAAQARGWLDADEQPLPDPLNPARRAFR